MELKDIYEKYNYPSLSKFLDIIKHDNLDFTKSNVKKFLDSNSVVEIYKKKKKKVNGHIIALVPNLIFQIDLIDVSKFEKRNEGYHWIAVIIDVYSRRAWAIPLKNKKSDTVYEELKEFFYKKKCVELMSDDGSEWKGNFSKMINDLTIHHDITNTVNEGHKSLGIVDRMCLTLKTIIYKSFINNHDIHWLHRLHKYVEAYNTTPHSFLIGSKQFTPIELYRKQDSEYNGKLLMLNNDANFSDFKIGDNIRILIKGIFKRGFSGNYSKEVYKIVTISNNNVILDNGMKVPIDEIISSKIPVEDVNKEYNDAIKEATIKRIMNKEGIEQNINIERPIRLKKIVDPIIAPILKPKIKKEYTIDRVFDHKIDGKKLLFAVHWSGVSEKDNVKYQWQPINNFIFRDTEGDRAINPLIQKYIDSNKIHKLVEKYI